MMMDTKIQVPAATNQSISKNRSFGKKDCNVKSVTGYVEAGGIAAMGFASIGKKAGWIDEKSSKIIGLTGLGITCLSSIPDIYEKLKGETGSKIADRMITSLMGLEA